MKRGIIIVLDAVGIGELPDAKLYGDENSNTLMHIKEQVPTLNLKNMCNLGLGLIDGYNIYEKTNNPQGAYCRLKERSKGKDTTTGHWEISGIHLDKPFPIYPNGFPDSIIKTFEKRINSKILGNCVASGTEIIKTLGKEHMKTGYPIVYTSADSVFQIAAHEDVIPLNKLYEICEIARDILQGEHSVARVIARKNKNDNDTFYRTQNRKDFSLPPVSKTLLDYAKEQGKTVACVGKIEDIFCNRGVTKSVHTHTNLEGINQTIKYLKEDFEGIIFTNLVDTDMLYGHRNDIKGFANSLQEFDNKLPEIISSMKDEDILFITSDHGCDPTTPSTDHSREYTFLLMYGKNITPQNLGTRETFSDIGKTIATHLNLKNNLDGKSLI